jgi:putative membrane protein
VLLRRTDWPGRGRALYGMGPGPLPVRAARRTAVSPRDVLGRRFAEGEIDENEYRRRLSVLERVHSGGTAFGHRAA